MPRVSSTNKELWRVKLGDYVTDLAWSPDGRHLAATSADGRLHVLDAATQTAEAFDAHAGSALVVAWSPDGSRLATGGQDANVHLWSPKAEKPHATLEAGRGWTEKLSWNVRGELATANGKIVRTWTKDGRPIDPPRATHASAIQGLAWDPVDPTRYAAAAFGGVTLWRAGNPEPEALFGWKGSMLSLEWAPDGKHVACGCQDSSVHVWIVKSAKDMEMSGYPTKVTRLAWDRRARFLATSGSPQCTVWDFGGQGPQGSTPRVLDAHDGNITDVSFQRTADALATSGAEGWVHLWSLAKPKQPLATLRNEGPAISRLAWRADDAQIAIGDAEGNVSVHETQPPRVLPTPAKGRR